MKVAIINDMHFGRGGNNLYFKSRMRHFLNKVFFPELRKQNVNHLVIAGDTIESGETMNVHTINFMLENFFNRLHARHIETHVVLGNHDTYFKTTNSLSGLSMVLNHLDNVTLYDKPTTTHLGDMIPWITDENRDETMRHIKESVEDYAFAHIEVEGFSMYNNDDETDGLKASLFEQYVGVFSGHYHQSSEKGNIKYTGAPLQFTWADVDKDRGFNILDTETGNTEFIKNPYENFCVYNDKMDADGFDSRNKSLIYMRNGSTPLVDSIIEAAYKVEIIKADSNVFDEFDFESVGVVTTESMLNRMLEGMDSKHKDYIKKYLE